MLADAASFALLGGTLAALARWPGRALELAALGATAVCAWRGWTGVFPDGSGYLGLGRHLAHAWVGLANLALLLTGFDQLARHVERSQLPAVLAHALPPGRRGAAAVLAITFLLSAMIDNIAAALMGATLAERVLGSPLRVGYLAAIVAASNAGGSGSVFGDTTTTMIWLAGISPVHIACAYAGAVPAMLVIGWCACRQQAGSRPPSAVPAELHPRVDRGSCAAACVVLLATVVATVVVTLRCPEVAARAPCVGLAVWLALLMVAPWRRPDLAALVQASRGAAMLLCLVIAAAVLPVSVLPQPSPLSTAGLGLVSAVVDNIPLAALALAQGGYDGAQLAYAIGIGGTLLWFGSSAGVAVASRWHQSRTVGGWLAQGWCIPVGYAIGLGTLVLSCGWHPR